MRVGNELDALVAKEVMGWVRDGCHDERWVEYIPDPRHSPFYIPDHRAWVHCWKPSEDIEAAWQVVQKLRNDGLDVAIQALDEGDGFWWQVSIGEGPLVDRSGPDAAPEAICIAALKAVRG